MEIDPDVLVHFLDEYLCASADEEGRADACMLREVGFVQVTGGNLFRYRFARPCLHQLFAKYPARPEDGIQWSRRIAEALEQFYSPLTGQIADTMFRLFAAAGMEARATEYRRMPPQSPDLTTLIWHVQFFRDTVAGDDVFGTYQLFDVGFHLSSRIATESPHLWEHGYNLAHDLLRRSEALGERRRRADALYYAGWHLLNGGQPGRALPLAQSAAEIWHTLAADPPDEARGLNLPGLVLRDLGDLAGAKDAFERALRILERRLPPEHPHIRRVRENLSVL